MTQARSKTRLLGRLGLLISLASFVACGDDTTPDDAGGMDADGPEDAFKLDSGVHSDGGDVDSGVGSDGGDAGVSTDGGVLEIQSFVAGQGVTFSSGEVRVRVGNQVGSTFAQARAILGEPTRKSSSANARSYEWDLLGGATATIWFNNAGLNASPLDQVRDNDDALWIAIAGTLAPKDSNGVGIGSSQAEVEAAYGSPPRSTPITSPAGTLASYITTGVLFAYDTATGLVRTFTITRAYPKEPNAQIDIAGRRLRFTGGDIELEEDPISLVNPGSDQGDVNGLVGVPDTSGTVSVGNASLETHGYSFVGFEVFYHPLTNKALFVSIHAPFYGSTAGAPNDHGIGTAKATFETYLSSLGFGAGAPSSTSAELICYQQNGNAIGVTYSAAPETVTSIVLGLPSSSCP